MNTETLWDRVQSLSQEDKDSLLSYLFGRMEVIEESANQYFFEGIEKYLGKTVSCEACGCLYRNKAICPSCGFDDAIPVSDVPRELE